MKKFTRQQFEKLAKVGSIRPATNKDAPGEDLCETALEFGLANGYTLADICYFYAHTWGYKNDLLRQGRTDRLAFDEAYERFVHHAIYFGGTIIDAAPKVEQRVIEGHASAKNAKRARPGR